MSSPVAFMRSASGALGDGGNIRCCGNGYLGFRLYGGGGVHIRYCGNGDLGFRFYSGVGVHIRYCGYDCWRFRPYGGSLLANAPKVTKKSRPSIRCLARARHALTPALLRGPAATGHPWPGAASAASLPRYPLRNACVRPLGKGRVDQGQDQKPQLKPKPSALYALLVAAAAGCDRLRSRRKTTHLDPPDTPRRLAWRALRARSQPAAAATGIEAFLRSYLLRNACVWPLGKGRVDQGQDQKPQLKPKPGALYALLVAAAAGCDRLRSRRKTIHLDPPDAPRRLAWRALRARSQPAAAATGNVFSDRPTGRSPRVVFDFLAPSGGRVEVLRSGQPGRDAGLAAPGHGWPVAAAHGSMPE